MLYTGKPATLQDCNNPDWVPTLKMGYDVPVAKESVERYSRLQARKEGDMILILLKAYCY